MFFYCFVLDFFLVHVEMPEQRGPTRLLNRPSHSLGCVKCIRTRERDKTRAMRQKPYAKNARLFC